MKKIALLLICLMAALAFAACNKGDGDPDSLVITPPTNLTYIAGTQELDLTGGTVAVKYTKGKVKDKKDLSDAANVKVEYDLRVAGTIPVTVKYQDLTGTFDVTVIPAEDAVSMEVSTKPYKTSYGPYVSESHVEKRGGELSITFKDGSTAPLKTSDPLVSVYSVDKENKKIQMLCYGLLADFEYTLNDNEIGYVTITKMPDRTTYRSNVTSFKEVELTGGEYILELKGKTVGSKNSFDNSDHRVEPIAIDVTRKFATIELDLQNIEGYKGKKVEARFDIDTVTEWPAYIKSITPPDSAFYLATQNEETIDLTGVEIEVAYENKDGETKVEKIQLPHKDVKVDSIKLDADDYELAHITLEYKDHIVTSQKIAKTFETAVVEDSHTEVTLFNYFVEQLPSFESLVWSRNTTLNERQQVLAVEAVDLYLVEDTDRGAIAEQAKIALPYGFYVEWIQNRHILFDKLDKEIEKLGASKAYKADFKTEVQKLDTDFSKFVTKYSNNKLEKVVMATSIDKNKNVTYTYLPERLKTANDYRNARLRPYLGTNGATKTSDAVDIAEKVAAKIDATGITKDDWKNNIVTDAMVRARKTGVDANIEAAYALLADVADNLDSWVYSGDWKDADWNNAKCATAILKGEAWRADALEIIYAYYYDDQFYDNYHNDTSAPIYIGAEYNRYAEDTTVGGYKIKAGSIIYKDIDGKNVPSSDKSGKPWIKKFNNIEIYRLLEHDIIAPLIEEAYPKLFNLARYVSFSENSFFIDAYDEYKNYIEELDDKGASDTKKYNHQVTFYTLQAYRISAYYNPASISSSDSSSAMQTAPLIDWADYADTYYRGMLTQTVRKNFLADDVISAFLSEYAVLLNKYVPDDAYSFSNPFPVGNTAFDAEFESVFESFNELSHSNKGIFLQVVDAAVLAATFTSPTTGKQVVPSYFSLMMDSYLQSKLAEGKISGAEFDLYRRTIEAYTVLTFTCFDGLTTSRMNDFNALYAEINRVNNGIQVTKSQTFRDYVGDMFNFCQETSESFEKITPDMYSVINEFYGTYSYAKKHQNTGNDVEGFFLITSLKRFDEVLANWKRDYQKSMTHLNVIVLDGNTMEDLYDDVNDIYKKSYELYDGTTGFKNIFRVGEKWLAGYDMDPDTGIIKDPQFLIDAMAVITEFNEHYRYYQFQYFNTSATVFSGILLDYYKALGLAGAELTWLSSSIFNYYMFLLIDFGKTGFLKADVAIAEANKLSDPVKKAEELARIQKNIYNFEDLLYGSRLYEVDAKGKQILDANNNPIPIMENGKIKRGEGAIALFKQGMETCETAYDKLPATKTQQFKDTISDLNDYKIFGEWLGSYDADGKWVGEYEMKDGKQVKKIVYRDLNDLYEMWQDMITVLELDTYVPSI